MNKCYSKLMGSKEAWEDKPLYKERSVHIMLRFSLYKACIPASYVALIGPAAL